MTKEQERARARRRYNKRRAQLAQKQAAAARNKRVAAVVGVLVLIVALVVGLSRMLPHSGPRAQAVATSAAAASAPVTPAKPAAGCTTPPPAPSAVPSVAAPDLGQAPRHTYTAVVTTTCGALTLELDGVDAPQAVASFRHLAAASFWAGSPCHRVTTAGIYVLQCGDPTGMGQGAPGYGFPVENAPATGDYPRGTLAMARSEDPKKGNGSQFFIVYKDSKLPTTTGGYSIFGKVTGGMDIVDKIAAAGVMGGGTDGRPGAPISILRVVVTEKKA